MWNSLGSKPAPDELEVTVIGPGHGESVVVHLGNDEWLVVDSCVTASTQAPRSAPLLYLQSIGVDPSVAVKLIVVSHWDDDHASGISELVAKCPNAVFACAETLTKRDFIQYVEMVATRSADTGTGNVSEFRRVYEHLMEQDRLVRKATPGRQLLDSGYPRVRSWSPSDYEMTRFMAYVAQNSPADWAPSRRAVPCSPNMTSVVLTIDWDHTSVLLGADMEAAANDQRGWGAIVAEGSRNDIQKCAVVKVPHHGSESSHDPRMWSELLEREPIAVIAPFGRGPINSRPPKSSDVRRITALSSATFLTAPHSPRKPTKKDIGVERALREHGIQLLSASTPMGLVRLRKQRGTVWRYELFGPARACKAPANSRTSASSSSAKSS